MKRERRGGKGEHSLLSQFVAYQEHRRKDGIREQFVSHYYQFRILLLVLPGKINSR